MAIRTYGPNAVDWEQRDRPRPAAHASGWRASRPSSSAPTSAPLLTFDFSNIRYMTATHIGTWAMDKLIRFALLPRGGEPVLWDFGSAAKPPPALQPLARRAGDADGASTTAPAPASPRCAAPSTPTPASPRRWPRKVADGAARARPRRRAARRRRHRAARPVRAAARRASRSSTASRCSSRPAGSRPPTRSACSPRPARWSTPPTRSSTSSCARACGRTSASAWSARCSTTSAPSTSRASTRSPASGARRTRTSTPTASSGPGDPAFFDILHSYMGYRTCYYRTLRRGQRVAGAARCLHPLPRVHGPRHRRWCKPGATTADIVAVWPTAPGVRLRRRGGGVRAAVRPRRRPVASGRSRSSAGWSRSTTPRCSRRAWSSRSRPTGRPPTAGRRPGSRRRSWSPPTAARSSPSSRPRSCSSPASAT